jgi:uncharacterized protein (DUF697 family)
MWKAFADLNVVNIREEAQDPPRVALVGPAEKTDMVQALLREGPRAGGQVVTAPPAYRWPLDDAHVEALGRYDLRILLLDSPAQAQTTDVQAIMAQAVPTLIVLDAQHEGALTVGDDGEPGPSPLSGPQRVLSASLADPVALAKELPAALVRVLDERKVALGRAYPGLRHAASQKLIRDTCMANAAYALGTGVAEMIPGLGIPFAVADVIILTRNQVIMAYKIALVMGETGTLREVLPQMASVVGAGFMWRQIARELVVFIPLGVVLKVGIAYAGTFATGEAMYHWYATGEKLRGRDLKRLLAVARQKGQVQARQMVGRLRRGEAQSSQVLEAAD